jgi:hypothetical protein
MRDIPQRDSRRASFIVIRVWVEPGDRGMRGRIVRGPNATGDEHDALAVSTPDAVYESVREWLEGFLTDEAVQA